MEFLDPAIEQYINDHISPESEILRSLNRETHQKVLQPRMLSGHLQGRFISMLSHMIHPKRVLEIGTYTGYSALCFAEGLAEDGHIDTIDKNEELEPIIQRYIDEAGLSKKIKLHIGDALEIIKTLDHTYDLVFIDADKENYLNYYNAIFPMVQIGGYILADNVLWSGKILDKKEIENDADTRAIVEYNAAIQKDERVENVLFPIRDGIMISRKIAE